MSTYTASNCMSVNYEYNYRPYGQQGPVGKNMKQGSPERINKPSMHGKNYVVRKMGPCSPQMENRVDPLSLSTQKALWDIFYRRRGSGCPAYPARNYFLQEFQEFLSDSTTLLEIGCGNGSTIIPLLTPQKKIEGSKYHGISVVTGIDISQNSLQRCLQSIEEISEGGRARVVRDGALIKVQTTSRMVINLVKADITAHLLWNCGAMSQKYDSASMIFLLSALPPHDVTRALRNTHLLLNAGKHLYFRDYCLDDYVKMDKIFLREQSVKGHIECYMRKNGTLITLFSEDYLSNLFELAGFRVICIEVLCKKFKNRKIQKSWNRLYIQCILQRME